TFRPHSESLTADSGALRDDFETLRCGSGTFRPDSATLGHDSGTLRHRSGTFRHDFEPYILTPDPYLVTLEASVLTPGPSVLTVEDAPVVQNPEASPSLLGAHLTGGLAGLSALAGFSALPPLTSMDAADIRYWMVTVAPTLRSPVTFVEASRAISQRSLPFFTVIVSLVSSS